MRGDAHYITSMSAWIAPEALMACRMPIRSRGPMPRPVEAVDQLLQRDAILHDGEFLAVFLNTDPCVGVTIVRPRENGAGWLTCGLSEIVT